MYGKTKTNQLENPNQRQNQARKSIHLHTSTPRVIPLGCLIQNDHITHVRYLSKNKQIQDHSPSMTLFKVALQNDLSPSKRMLRYLATLLIMAIR